MKPSKILKEAVSVIILAGFFWGCWLGFQAIRAQKYSEFEAQKKMYGKNLIAMSYQRNIDEN